MSWLGLDIGGANLKAALGSGWTAHMPFPLWRRPAELSAAVRQLAAQVPSLHRASGWAVTMTGELADCYEDKTHGVREIVAATERAGAGVPIRYYATDGAWLSAAAAVQQPLLVAASNWHALARWIATSHSGGRAGLLIDAGSTTVDIIPLAAAEPIARGTTDWTRLVAAELVYTGIERTPVPMVLSEFRWSGMTAAQRNSGGHAQREPKLETPRETKLETLHGGAVRLAAELFATMKDVYVVLGDLPPDAADCDTADGRPATVDAAITRLRRLVCADPTEFADDSVRQLAEQAAVSQTRIVADAVQTVLARHPATQLVVISGHGNFLVRRVLEHVGWHGSVMSLQEHWTAEVARCAPAYAVAQLAQRELSPLPITL